MSGIPEYLPRSYDTIVVGAGVAGCALAYALGSDGRQVLLLERDLREPDRIVGELMQPGGCRALAALGMADTLEGIDAIDVHGYAILQADQTCHCPYPTLAGEREPVTGKSFHHGRFIQRLREKCIAHPNVQTVQATVTNLVRDLADEPRVVGVNAVQRNDNSETHLEFHAPLTFVADGCYSKFRSSVLGTTMLAPSHFVGLILKDCTLPMVGHGNVVLANPSPILLYQIATRDTRILVDMPGSSMPSNRAGKLVTYLQDHIAPQLPACLQSAFLDALKTQTPRIMPNPYLPSRPQGTTPGLIIVGDAHNMRHPLTGGGMTVALNDAVILRDLLNKRDFPTFDSFEARAKLPGVLRTWYWRRKKLSSVINILANALYSLFSAGDDPTLFKLRKATFDYLCLGGECTAAPARLLACVAPQPFLLVRHFFAVAIFATWTAVRSHPWWRLPLTLWDNAKVLSCAVRVIAPLCWYEVRGAPITSRRAP